jgi:hypothetical protein
MDRVDAIAGQYFDFGSPPKGGGLSDPNFGDQLNVYDSGGL